MNENLKNYGSKQQMLLKLGIMKVRLQKSPKLKIDKELRLQNELMMGLTGDLGYSEEFMEVLAVLKRVKKILIGS
jgi:hypothetical protein